MSEVIVAVEEKRPVEMDPQYDGPVISTYRPFSRAAIIAVPLTLFSGLALISPILWIIPIAAVFFSAIAVRVTCSGEQPLLGRKVAIVCLIVSWFLLGYAPAQFITSRVLVSSQAKSFANRWLQLVKDGELPEAHQLHLMYYERAAPDTDLKKYYEQKFPETGGAMRKQIDVHDPYGDMMEFFKTTPLKEFVEAGKNGREEIQLQNVSVLADESRGPVTYVELRYRFTFSKDGQQTWLPMHIRMKRTMLPKSGSKQWNVDSVTTGGSAPPKALKK